MSDVASFLRQAVLIVPFPPGGSTAHTAEVLADALAQACGSRIALDYRTGDYGLTALRALTEAGAGALMIGNIITASMTPVIRSERMSFEFTREIRPVSKLAEFPSILMTGVAVPVDDVAGLLQWCRQRDGVLRYGSDYLGTFVDVDAIALAARAGLTAALHESGSANGVLAALVAGKIDMALLNVATAAANRGRYKPLAISGPHRLAGFGSLPTLAEAGFEGIGVIQWQGLFASRQLPPALLAALHATVVSAMCSAEAQAAMRAIDAAVVTSPGPADFAAEIGAEMARWAAMKAQILAVPKV